MKRYICIHGHFYQPYRANPWLETIELQEDAYPYHDWNDRINSECYMVNTGAHILGESRKIKKCSNNYSSISFNFGPGLLSWIKTYDRNTYESIIEADRLSIQKFGGHGSAIAQVYNHIIMPLTGRREKYIQVYWAIKDFEANFGRKPEGIWLSETAVDYETLEVLCELGLKYTILSPNQAAKVRRISTSPDSGSGKDGWISVEGGTINTRMPYLCRLASGSSISIFFYDNDISTRLSFGSLLENGNNFVNALVNAPAAPAGFGYGDKHADKTILMPEIVCVASDGETFGHHHKFGDMALAYAIDQIESKNLAELTVFGQYLEKYSPQYEVDIIQNSSWSCSHGVCRWSDDCGCFTGSAESSGWNQKWRKPLRKSIDWLSKKVGLTYEKEIKKYIEAPQKNTWKIIENYIAVINDRSEVNVHAFLDQFMPEKTGALNSKKDIVKVLKILEMYRQGLLMQSSDGWFFDEISRIESIQIMRHACRVIELIKDLTDDDFQEQFTRILKSAKSNISAFKDGKYIYELFANTAAYDFKKITAYFAFETLLDKNQEYIFSFKPEHVKTYRYIVDHGKIIAGTARLTSTITLESAEVFFAAYDFKYKNILSNESMAAFCDMAESHDRDFTRSLDAGIKRILNNKKTEVDEKESQIVRLFESSFDPGAYTLKDLLKDKQVEIAETLILDETSKINPVLLRLFNDYEITLQDFSQKKIHNYFLDGIFPDVHKFIGEVIVYNKLKEKELGPKNLEELKEILARTNTGIFINSKSFDLLSQKKLEQLIEAYLNDPENEQLLTNVTGFLDVLQKSKITPDMWKSQYKIFKAKQDYFNAKKKNAGSNLSLPENKFKALLDKLNLE